MLKKRYLADNKTCKVTFTTHKDGTHAPVKCSWWAILMAGTSQPRQ